jgi:hypothetical protein
MHFQSMRDLTVKQHFLMGAGIISNSRFMQKTLRCPAQPLIHTNIQLAFDFSWCLYFIGLKI